GQLKPRIPFKGEPLAADEIKLIEAWIKNLKAPDDGGAADAKSWWAVQKIAKPTPPAVKDAGRVHSPIDRFVLSRLEQIGISPADEAPRNVLLRRAFFDLVGMPPTAA